MALYYPQNVYNHYMKSGHVIKKSLICPPRRTGGGYVGVTTLASSFALPNSVTQILAFPSPTKNSIIPEMNQQMVICALSTLGVSGNPSTTHSWLLDSGTCNHMTHKPLLLSNLRPYT